MGTQTPRYTTGTVTPADGFGAVAGLSGIACGGVSGLAEGSILGLPLAAVLGPFGEEDR